MPVRAVPHSPRWRRTAHRRTERSKPYLEDCALPPPFDPPQEDGPASTHQNNNIVSAAMDRKPSCDGAISKTKLPQQSLCQNIKPHRLLARRRSRMLLSPLPAIRRGLDYRGFTCARRFRSKAPIRSRSLPSNDGRDQSISGHRLRACPYSPNALRSSALAGSNSAMKAASCSSALAINVPAILPGSRSLR